jgi:hypothetical protein
LTEESVADINYEERTEDKSMVAKAEDKKEVAVVIPDKPNGDAMYKDACGASGDGHSHASLEDATDCMQKRAEKAPMPAAEVATLIDTMRKGFASENVKTFAKVRELEADLKVARDGNEEMRKQFTALETRLKTVEDTPAAVDRITKAADKRIGMTADDDGPRSDMKKAAELDEASVDYMEKRGFLKGQALVDARLKLAAGAVPTLNNQ